MCLNREINIWIFPLCVFFFAFIHCQLFRCTSDGAYNPSNTDIFLHPTQMYFLYDKIWHQASLVITNPGFNRLTLPEVVLFSTIVIFPIPIEHFI